MSDFETYNCEHCGDEFAAHESANAAENGYCSPECRTAAN